MDAKEAIEYFEGKTYEMQFISGGIRGGKSYRQEAYKAAIEALEKAETLEAENARLKEKQTPKELVWDEHNRFYCDRCGKEISMPQYTPYRYCQFCGGRIKDEEYE